MALVVQGAYTFPTPDINGYHSYKTRIDKLRKNAKGVRIGEFSKWQYGVTVKYNYLLGTSFHAMMTSAEGSDPVGGVSTTFYDDDSGTYMTKTMLLESVTKELFRESPESYVNVTLNLLEL